MHAPAPACAVRRAASSLLSDAGSSTGFEPSSTAGSWRVSSLAQSAASSTEQLLVVSGPPAELLDEHATALSVAAAKERPVGREESESEWKLEADAVDCPVRVLPGVKALLASIPEERHGARTYGAHCVAPPLPPCPCDFGRD